ncbi:MAG: ABC-2 family transporter protein [Chloroflexota bacterium]
MMRAMELSGLTAIYFTQLKTSLAVQFQYRFSMGIWMISRVLEPLIYLVVWTTITKAQGGEVSGYAAGDFSAYFIVLMVVNQATFTWIMFVYDFKIRSGEFNFTLLRPLHPIHADIADNVAYKILTLVILIPAIFFLAWLFPPTFNPEPWYLLAGILATIVAFVGRFIMEWTLAMAALWTTRTNAINQTYYVFLFFMSGQIAPLDVMPNFIQVLSFFFPFRWHIAFPVQLILGRLTPQEVLLGFAMQIGWLIAALFILSVVWRAGIKQYSAVGS